MRSAKKYTLTLTRDDIMNITDALADRKESYEMTARYHEGKEVEGIIEEVSDYDEAIAIAENFRKTLNRVDSQLAEQKSK